MAAIDFRVFAKPAAVRSGLWCRRVEWREYRPPTEPFIHCVVPTRCWTTNISTRTKLLPTCRVWVRSWYGSAKAGVIARRMSTGTKYRTAALEDSRLIASLESRRPDGAQHNPGGWPKPRNRSPERK